MDARILKMYRDLIDQIMNKDPATNDCPEKYKILIEILLNKQRLIYNSFKLQCQALRDIRNEVDNGFADAHSTAEAGLREMLAKSSEAIAQPKQQLLEARNLCKNHAANIEKLQSRNDEYERNHQAVKCELAALHGQLTNRDEKLDELSNELMRSKSGEIEKGNELLALKARVHQLEDQQKQHSSTYEALSAELESSKLHLKKQRDEVTSLAVATERFKSQVMDKDAELLTVRSELEESKRSKAQLGSSCYELQSRLAGLAGLDSVNESLKEEKDAMQKELVRLMSDNTSLVDRVEDAKRALRQAEAKEAALSRDLRLSSGEKSEIHTQLGNIKEKVHALESGQDEEVVSLREALSAARLQRDESVQAHAAMRARCESLSTLSERQAIEAEQMKQQIAEMKENAQQQEEAFKVKEAALSLSQKEAKDVAFQYKVLRGKEDSWWTDYEALQAQLRAKCAECDAISASRESTAAAEGLQRALEKSEANSQQLRRRCDELEDEASSLRDTVRRECEERTSMLILLSEIRDEWMHVHGSDTGGGVGRAGLLGRMNQHIDNPSSLGFHECLSGDESRGRGERPLQQHASDRVKRDRDRDRRAVRTSNDTGVYGFDYNDHLSQRRSIDSESDSGPGSVGIGREPHQSQPHGTRDNGHRQRTQMSSDREKSNAEKFAEAVETSDDSSVRSFYSGSRRRASGEEAWRASMSTNGSGAHGQRRSMDKSKRRLPPAASSMRF
jgi:chromosome segregation ATPase